MRLPVVTLRDRCSYQGAVYSPALNEDFEIAVSVDVRLNCEVCQQVSASSTGWVGKLSIDDICESTLGLASSHQYILADALAESSLL